MHQALFFWTEYLEWDLSKIDGYRLLSTLAMLQWVALMVFGRVVTSSILVDIGGFFRERVKPQVRHSSEGK